MTLDDLSTLAELSASAHEPQALYAAVDTLVQKVIGHRLFTIMRVHEAAMEVERVYSSNADGVSGRRPQEPNGSRRGAGPCWKGAKCSSRAHRTKCVKLSTITR